MLKKLLKYEDIDREKLMAVYIEGNTENGNYFFPNEPDRVKKAEDGFMNFLKDTFYRQEGNVYYVLEEDGQYKSALRLSDLGDRVYYLEALETIPEMRRQGYAAKLINAVFDELKAHGSFTVRDCVSKKNTASLATHKKCGFVIDTEEGYDYLNNETNSKNYGMLYVSE